MRSIKYALMLSAALFVGPAMAQSTRPAAPPATPTTKPAAAQPGKTTTTADGLEITVVEEAKSVGAQEGDVVWVHYTGKLTNDTIFDSSVAKNRPPLRLTLGQKEVIPGWEQGLIGMKLGEKRKLVIPPKLAYGDEGRPPQIPGKSTLVFDVELVGIARPPQAK